MSSLLAQLKNNRLAPVVGVGWFSSPRVLQARASFLTSLVYSLELLALGGIITGIAYVITSPGGTYVVTSGLFLIGGIYLCVAVWNLFKWLALIVSEK